MDSIEPYINTIIALLGLAYPILLQVISRLDEKYSSEHIVELFDKEVEFKSFKYLLIAALVCIFLWSLKLEPLISVSGFDFIIGNSAAILVGLGASLLVVAFFFFVRKILIYYTPTKIIPYLTRKHKEGDADFRYFTALSDILLLSIRQQQRNVTLTLSDFFYAAFASVRQSSKDLVEYPGAYYDIVYKSIEELAILKEKRNYALEYRTAGGIWLLGELQGKEISEKTFGWLWKNLLLAIRYEQDDLIVYHWETAHQYYEYSLPIKFKEINYASNTFQVSNEEEVRKREAERQRFIEFHYMLGGLLTYKNRFECIRRIIRHTNSQPPKYVLLPDSMLEIFRFYFSVRDPYDRKYTWISSQYPFPEQSGLNADSVVKKWVCSYLAILFLRQYTIVPYLTTMKPLEYPQIPGTQGEIKEWIEGLDFFEKLIDGHLRNADLLSQLDLGFITRDWCVEHGKPYPMDFIKELRAKLEAAYQDNALNLLVSPDKIALFKASTKEIIEKMSKSIKRVSNQTSFNDVDVDRWYINGQNVLQSKDAFSADPEVHHINFDSFLATSVAEKNVEGFATTFYKKKTSTYLLKPEDIFPAVRKLNIDEQYVIICFGVNLEYYIDNLKIVNLAKDKYEKIEIYSFPGSRLVNSSFFIIKRVDLPYVSHKPIPEEIINKYSLEKISEDVNLYVSIIDLNNTTEEIFNENQLGETEDELKKSVLLSLRLTTEVTWKKDIELIRFVQYFEYEQRGLVNSLTDVEPIEVN